MKRIIYFLLVTALLLSSCANPGVPGESESLSTERDVYQGGETESGISENSEFVSETLPTETFPSGGEVILSAEDILASMSVEEKVGQLFLARNPKTAEDGVAMIEDLHVGGVIFFGRDFKNSTPDNFKELIKLYNETAKLPVLTAVDEEGGTVCRASLYKPFRDEKFEAPAIIYAEGGLEAVLNDAAEKSEFLLSLGLNFNLAPVADISTDPDDFIFERSLGLGRDETSEFVSSVVTVMCEKGILSSLKHFPGYGNNEDTHTGIAYDKRSLDEIKNNDLVPFEAGIEAGAPVVMVSHNIVECIDSERPASLSEKAVSLLRDEMGFEGVIMTDDLSMDAIGDFTSGADAAVLAVIAGVDLLCSSDVEVQYEAVLSAVNDGRISEERLNDSVLRILRMKLRYGIIK